MCRTSVSDVTLPMFLETQSITNLDCFGAELDDDEEEDDDGAAYISEGQRNTASV